MSSDDGSSEVASNEGHNHSPDLANKVLNVDKRIFYIDVKKNERGKFVQIVAVSLYTVLH